MRDYAKSFRATLTAWLMLFAIEEVAAAGPLEDAHAAYNRDDYATVLRLLRPLADQGNADAQDLLGVMYAVGQGLSQNRAEATKLFRLAAKQGNPHAQDNLGYVYQLGLGVKQDYAEAARWYRKAADQGNVDAQFNLGGMYELDTGVPEDYVLAYMWFNLVAAPGTRPYATGSRDRVAQHMTPEQIAEAQKLAREWKPKPER